MSTALTQLYYHTMARPRVVSEKESLLEGESGPTPAEKTLPTPCQQDRSWPSLEDGERRFIYIPMVMVRVRGVVLAATGPIGFPKRRSGGVLNYDAVHLVRGPLMHYNYYRVRMRRLRVTLHVSLYELDVYSTCITHANMESVIARNCSFFVRLYVKKEERCL